MKKIYFLLFIAGIFLMSGIQAVAQKLKTHS